MQCVNYVGYIDQVRDAGERVLMARIALNVLYDADQYPVDVSEILSLSPLSFAASRSFMAWSAIQHNYSTWTSDLAIRLRALAEGRFQ